MKSDTVIICIKGGCYLAIGAATPLTVSLAQWANSGEWPPGIIWVVIFGACVVGGATQLLSFLSGSYADYKQSRLAAKFPDPAPAPIPDNRPG